MSLLSLIKIADIGDKSNYSAVSVVEAKRKDYGLTQKQMAQVLKMQPSHYNEFIKGKRSLPPKAMRRAASIGCCPRALLQQDRGATP